MAPGAFEVHSPSGKATLTIPEGALPAGLDASTIQIKEPPLRAELAEFALLALELEPSGTVFLKPLTLSFSVDSDLPAPIVALVSGTTVEFAPTTIEIDPAASEYVALAEITHFSTVVAGTGNVGISITNSGDHTVGAPFQLSVTISKIAESVIPTVTLPTDGAFEKTVSAVENIFHHKETFGALTIQPGSFDSSSFLISPRHVDNVPNGSVTIDEDSFTFSQTFNCTAAATVDSIRYEGSSDQAVRITSFIGLSITSSVPKRLWFKVRTLPFRCLEPSVTPSPSPSPTPSPAVEVVTSLPEGHISGMCWRYGEGPPPVVNFTMYWYGFPINSIEITLEGANNGVSTAVPFDPAGPGFESFGFPVDQGGPVKIKQVIVEKPDGAQVDITKPFTDFLETDTLDPATQDAWGSIC